MLNNYTWLSIRRMSSVRQRTQMRSFSVSMCLYLKCFFKDGRRTSVFSCHRVRSGATEGPDCLSRWISSMRCHKKKKKQCISFLFLGDRGCHCFPVWQLAAPSLLSTPPLSLQCCSLLNYYQWVWRDTCSLSSHYLLRDSLSHSLSLSLSHTHAHACEQTLGLYLIWHGFAGYYAQTRRDLYSASD